MLLTPWQVKTSFWQLSATFRRLCDGVLSADRSKCNNSGILLENASHCPTTTANTKTFTLIPDTILAATCSGVKRPPELLIWWVSSGWNYNYKQNCTQKSTMYCETSLLRKGSTGRWYYPLNKVLTRRWKLLEFIERRIPERELTKCKAPKAWILTREPLSPLFPRSSDLKSARVQLTQEMRTLKINLQSKRQVECLHAIWKVVQGITNDNSVNLLSLLMIFHHWF